ncbi:MAG: phage antirepressor N-terminal domain-containing protein [Thermodesulfobacteriota bacterium]
MNTQLLPVPFHGDKVFLVEHENDPFCPIKPIVDNIGLDWKTQYVKLKSNPKRWGMVMIPIPTSGGIQKAACIPLRKCPAFLLSIDSRRVNPELRTKLELYQNECDDALWDYWTKGVAVNPHVNGEDETITLDKGKYVRLLERQNELLEERLKLIEIKKISPYMGKKCRRISKSQVDRVIELRAKKRTMMQIAEDVGISVASVSYITRFNPIFPKN